MWRGIGAVLRGWLEGDFWIVPWFERVAGELVVYSSKWTTGSALFLVFALFWAISWELVDHWRVTFPGFRPGSGIFPGASGPLDRVVH